MSLFKLGAKPQGVQQWTLSLAGFVVLIGGWWLLAEMFSTQKPIIDYQTQLPSSLSKDSLQMATRDSLAKIDSLHFAQATKFEKIYPILPPPHLVIGSFPSLIKEDKLLENSGRSVWLNIQGYFWAILLSIPIGFLIGLFPLFRGMFSRQVDSLRYLPLTALTGLFIIWFGIEDQMKIAFLAFGILVYLLPVVVQRIDEVEDVYLTTVYTLGANNWQTIRTVYLPSVLSRLMDDIRVLTAISWTYIIIAELLNRQGGIGSLIFLKGKMGQIEKVFAILIVIILIGFIQDRIFAYLDKRLFPHKYYNTSLDGIHEVQYGIIAIFSVMALSIFQSILLPGFSGIMFNLVWITIIAALIILLYGEWKVQNSLKHA